jgi:hypothetical protein
MKFDITNPKKDKILEGYLDKLTALKKRLSKLRKGAYDTQFIEPFILNVAPKVKMAKATYEDVDMDKVKDDVNWIENQIEIIEQNRDFPQIYQKVQEIYDLLRVGDNSQATILYLELRNDYKSLDGKSKETIYVACLDIHERLNSAKEKKFKPLTGNVIVKSKPNDERTKKIENVLNKLNKNE